MLIVLSGPSGVGKSLTLRHLISRRLCGTIVPFTTRRRRPSEVDGRDYYFRSEITLRILFDDFRSGYWDQPLGADWYGYSALVDVAAVQARYTVIQASSSIALALKAKHPQAQIVFCDFASDDTMYRRIKLRCESCINDIEVRLRHARAERSRSNNFDAIIRLDDPFELRDEVVREFDRIVGNLA